MRLMLLTSFRTKINFCQSKDFSFGHIEKSQGPLLKNLSFVHSPPTHAPLFGQAYARDSLPIVGRLFENQK